MNKRKISKNSKITRFSCIRCQTMSVKTRRDSKYCSDLCRVQESNDRKEAGFTHRVCKGTQREVREYFRNAISALDYGRLGTIRFDIEEWLERLTTADIQKQEFDGILIYHYPHIKKAPFDVYLTDSMVGRLKSTMGMQASLPKIIGKSK